MSGECCALCRFFHTHAKQATLGECRVRAPAVLDVQRSVPYGAGKYSSIETHWPEVAPTAWCGEFESRADHERLLMTLAEQQRRYTE